VLNVTVTWKADIRNGDFRGEAGVRAGGQMSCIRLRQVSSLRNCMFISVREISLDATLRVTDAAGGGK